MHGRGDSNNQFSQFFEEMDDMVHTPSRRTSRVVVSTPSTRMSMSELEKSAANMTPRMKVMLKKEQKAREEAANLTFRPNVNKTTKGSSPGVAKVSHGSSNRFDALYSDALKRHLESKWKEATDKELTFTPKITERGRSRASSRATSRTGSRASSKERNPETPTTEATAERLHGSSTGKLKHGVDPDNKLTFKPEITKRAKSIDRKESAKRLYASNTYEVEQAKDIQRKILSEERQLENCTFQPKLNPPNKYSPKVKLDIRDRMAKFEEMKKQKIAIAQKQKVESELADATFSPVLLSKQKRSSTPNQSFPERLSQPFERHVPEQVQRELSASMTFKPTLVTKRAASVSPPICSSISICYILCLLDIAE